MNSPGTSSAERLGFALFRIGLEVARVYESELSPLGLRHEHAGVLLAIGHAGPLHIRGLARHLGCNRQTVVNVVDALESRGAVERVADTADARVALVRLKNPGRALLQRVELASARMDLRMNSVGSEEQRATVLKFLQTLAESPVLGTAIDLRPRRKG